MVQDKSSEFLHRQMCLDPPCGETLPYLTCTRQTVSPPQKNYNNTINKFLKNTIISFPVVGFNIRPDSVANQLKKKRSLVISPLWVLESYSPVARLWIRLTLQPGCSKQAINPASLECVK